MKTGSEFHVGIVGLGSMGMGAALSCVRAGLSTWGADLNSNTCATLKEAGACGVSDNAATFAEKLDALLVLVVNATQVKQVDAPVSGGAVKAANGEMTVMASGSDIAFERLAPVLEAVAGKVYRIGAEPGLGSTVKIIHQLLAGVHIAAGAEAMALAARAGIPLDVMYDVVTNAAGNSWMFENRMRHVVDGDYTPHSAVDIFVKDLGLVADTAKALHFPLPLASTALNMFTSASNAGYGKEDDSAVIKIFSGITLPGAKS